MTSPQPLSVEEKLLHAAEMYRLCAKAERPQWLAALTGLIQEAERKAELKAMGLVLHETGGEFVIHKKAFVSFDDKCTIEVYDDPVKDAKVYRIYALLESGGLK